MGTEDGSLGSELIWCTNMKIWIGFPAPAQKLYTVASVSKIPTLGGREDRETCGSLGGQSSRLAETASSNQVSSVRDKLIS